MYAHALRSAQRLRCLYSGSEPIGPLCIIIHQFDRVNADVDYRVYWFGLDPNVEWCLNSWLQCKIHKSGFPWSAAVLTRYFKYILNCVPRLLSARSSSNLVLVMTRPVQTIPHIIRSLKRTRITLSTAAAVTVPWGRHFSSPNKETEPAIHIGVGGDRLHFLFVRRMREHVAVTLCV